MIKGVFLDSSTLGKDLDWTALKALPIKWDFFETTNEEYVLERIQGASIVVTNKVKLNNTHFIAAPTIKLICLAATGMDNIDVAAAKARDMSVLNVEGYATNTVVQHTFGMILDLASQLPRYQQLVQEGAWQKSPIFCLNHLPTFDLAGKTLGVIGYGRLGQGVARVAQALGMKIQIAESFSTSNSVIDRGMGSDLGVAVKVGMDINIDATPRTPFKELMSTSDVVSLHCPLTDKTKEIINEQSLSWMKKTSLLVNTARGGLINEQALVKALRNNQIRGAALDTLSQEPPTLDSPFFPLPNNLLITPHSAWSTQEARQRLLMGITQNIENFIKGQDKDKNNRNTNTNKDGPNA